MLILGSSSFSVVPLDPIQHAHQTHTRKPMAENTFTAAANQATVRLQLGKCAKNPQLSGES